MNALALPSAVIRLYQISCRQAWAVSGVAATRRICRRNRPLYDIALNSRFIGKADDLLNIFRVDNQTLNESRSGDGPPSYQHGAPRGATRVMPPRDRRPRRDSNGPPSWRFGQRCPARPIQVASARPRAEQYDSLVAVHIQRGSSNRADMGKTTRSQIGDVGLSRVKIAVAPWAVSAGWLRHRSNRRSGKADGGSSAEFTVRHPLIPPDADVRLIEQHRQQPGNKATK